MTVIAVDGTAASGKGTLAKKLAEHYGFAHLDSGTLYRAVALSLIRAGIDPGDERRAADTARALTPAMTRDPEIRSREVGNAASIVAAFGSVRQALIEVQRQFVRNPPANAPGCVLDGRDIGTVICPDAEVKIFVDADERTRARRRYAELCENARVKGVAEPLTEEGVLADIRARDRRDRTRPVAPLKQADDAYLLDSTNLSIEATFKAACDIVDRVLKC